jgi:hypothetical protein
MLKMLNHGYSQQLIVAFIIQPPFKFWSAAHHTSIELQQQRCNIKAGSIYSYQFTVRQ